MLIAAFLYEILACVLLQFRASAVFFPNRCIHIIGLSFVSEATTFSYSLTAFLLVAVTVVFAIGKQVSFHNDEGDSDNQGEPPDDDFPDGGLRFVVTLSSPNKTEDDYLTTYGFIDTVEIEYQEGEQIRGNGGNGPYWGLIGHDEVTAFVEEFSSEPLFRFGRGIYILYQRDELTDEEMANLEGKKWVTHPRFGTGPHVLIKILDPDVGTNGPDNNEPEPTDIEDEGNDSEITIEEFGRKLRKSLSYSISASLLGTLIVGFTPPPTIIRYTEVPLAPGVVESMSPFLFTISVYIFSVIFLGMVSTSIGLVDLMATANYTE